MKHTTVSVTTTNRVRFNNEADNQESKVTMISNGSRKRCARCPPIDRPIVRSRITVITRVPPNDAHPSSDERATLVGTNRGRTRGDTRAQLLQQPRDAVAKTSTISRQKKGKPSIERRVWRVLRTV